MQNRLRRSSKPGFANPFESATKNAMSSEGRYTFYAITICGLLGLILHKPVIAIVQAINPSLPTENAADLGIMITVGAMCALLVVSLLKMRAVIGFMSKRRLDSFNRRLEQRKRADKQR